MATITLTTTAGDDTRIAAAFGIYLGLGRPATPAEIKTQLGKYISETVRVQEYQTQQAAISITPIVPS